MTLSLDDVRNKRFRMARRSGYEVLEVDEFVDEVEVAFEQLAEENQNLKKQIEALQAAPAAEIAPAAEAAPAGGPSGPETIVVTTGAEASSAVVRLVAWSTAQAERLVDEATAEAAQIRDEATAAAQQLTGDAQARAERITAEAQETAERVRDEAQSRADHLDVEIADRRSELFDSLHSERDDLQVAVGQLRNFEASYRTSLANELRERLSSIEGGTAQPHDVPALASSEAVTEAQQRAAALADDEPAAESGPPAATPTSADTSTTEAADGDGSVFPDEDSTDPAEENPSETPRLDALLGDHR